MFNCPVPFVWFQAAVKETAKLRKVQQEQETKTKEEIADMTEKMAVEKLKAKERKAAAATALKVPAPPPPPVAAPTPRAAASADIPRAVTQEEVASSPADLLAEAKEKEKEAKAKLADKAKAEKTARRIGTQVDRLLQDLNGLVDKLGQEKSELLQGIHVGLFSFSN